MTVALLLASFGSACLIMFQDFTQRRIHVIILLVFVSAAGYLQFLNTPFFQIFLLESMINLSLLILMLSGIGLYFYFIRKLNPKDTLGKGDVLIFLAFAFGYDIEEFVIHFVIGLIAALTLHFILKRNYKVYTSVPLAGYLAVYFTGQKIIEYLNLIF